MKIPKHFYYITHIDNLKSILKRGIFSRSKIEGMFFNIFGPKLRSIHDESIIQKRKSKLFKGKNLWDYVNLYFQVRNPMLYRVARIHGESNIAILQINSDIIYGDDVGITDGNAASDKTQFFEDINKGLQSLDRSSFSKEFWSDTDDSKRKIMAELLVYNCIEKEKIIGIYVANEEIANKIRREIIGPLNVIPNSGMFFSPQYEKKISDKISLLKSDMFFSNMQTFTVSVNTVGVMGKGLASRAKYQFPDVYVQYQDLCKQKKLRMGVPVLYKREENFEKMLSEDTEHFVTENGNRWFLLFPTKEHWRTKSPRDGIEKGLQWLVGNYKSLGIKSIALPSLGCGLGGLSWRDIGPLMCQYMSKMDIPSQIYLPIEGDIPPEQLRKEFLLKEFSSNNNGS